MITLDKQLILLGLNHLPNKDMQNTSVLCIAVHLNSLLWYFLSNLFSIYCVRYIEIFKSSKQEIKYVVAPKPRPLMSTRPGPYDRMAGFGVGAGGGPPMGRMARGNGFERRYKRTVQFQGHGPDICGELNFHFLSTKRSY